MAANFGFVVFHLASAVRSSSDHVMYSSMRAFSSASVSRLSCLARNRRWALFLNLLGIEVDLVVFVSFVFDISLPVLLAGLSDRSNVSSGGGSAEKAGSFA